MVHHGLYTIYSIFVYDKKTLYFVYSDYTSTGLCVNDTHWASGEPNDFNYEEDCAELCQCSQTFNDNSCNNTYISFCNYGESIHQNPTTTSNIATTGTIYIIHFVSKRFRIRQNALFLSFTMHISQILVLQKLHILKMQHLL